MIFIKCLIDIYINSLKENEISTKYIIKNEWITYVFGIPL